MLNLVGLVHTHKVIGWCKEGKVAADGFQERIDTAHIKAAALKLGSRAALQATARTRQDKGQLWVLLLIIRVFCQEARAAALLLTTHYLLLTTSYCFFCLFPARVQAARREAPRLWPHRDGRRGVRDVPGVRLAV